MTDRDRGRGRLVFGILLLLVGVAWFVDLANILEVSWAALLPAALVVIGLAILFEPRRRPEPWLVVAGVVIAVILSASPVRSVVGVDAFNGGVGDVTERPTTVEAIEPYDVGAGELTIDLREIRFPQGTTELTANVGAGELKVLVPTGVGVHVVASVGVGEMNILGEQHGGFGLDFDETFPSEAGRTVSMKLSVGLGNLEVTR